MATIRFPTTLRPHVGGAVTLEIDGASVGEVLHSLGASYPELEAAIFNDDGTLHRFVNVYVDDDDVRYIGGLEAEVSGGQTISLIPAVAGGAL
jgi:molybdopterin converting factor small subunit